MSKIHTEIVSLISQGKLSEPFNVKAIKKCTAIIDRSPAFISKHAVGNPGKYTAYYKRVGIGLYILNPILDTPTGIRGRSK